MEGSGVHQAVWEACLVAHQLRIRPAGRDLGLPEERGDVGVKLQLKCHCESDRARVPGASE